MHQRHITFINHAIVILQFFICHANIASLVSVENREGRKEKEGKKIKNRVFRRMKVHHVYTDWGNHILISR